MGKENGQKKSNQKGQGLKKNVQQKKLEKGQILKEKGQRRGSKHLPLESFASQRPQLNGTSVRRTSRASLYM